MNAHHDQIAGTINDNLQIAIETTGRTGSLAVLSGETVLRQTQLDLGSRTAAALAPALDQTLLWCRSNKKPPDFISVADGPGSFTGLRIGVTTAKTFCYATQLPLVAVDSVAAIAANVLTGEPTINSILVGINAFRGQVFTAHLDRASLLPPVAGLSIAAVGTPWSARSDQVHVVDAEQWQDILAKLDATAPVSGDRSVFQSRRDLRFIQRQSVDAVGVGLLAIRACAVGDFADPLALVPRYLRPSAAEEKAAERG